MPRMLSLSLAAVWLMLALPAAAQDTTITYQGQLQQNGQPFTGTANLQFQMFDQLIDGNQVGSTVVETDWPVEDGLFQVELDFGTAAFDGSERFLEVWVNGAPLSPRQAVRPAPIAVHALNVSAGGEGSTPFNVNPTTGAIEYLFDDLAIRFEPYTDEFDISSPRVTLGHANNVASARGSVVSGGGRSTSPNVAEGLFSVVAGGRNNIASERESTISGGDSNIASGIWSTVSGGQNNRAIGVGSTVGGGTGNTATAKLPKSYSTVGGGSGNTASGNHSSVVGGSNNTASGRYSFVGGGIANCAGGRHSWAGGTQAKVRPGSSSGDSGTGCDGVALSPSGFGDQGTFLWADDTVGEFVSTGPNQFLVRAAGGMGINTNAPATNLHLGGLNTSSGTPDGLRLENTLSRSWDIHTSAQYLRFNYDSGSSNNNVAYVSVDGSWNQLSDRRLKRDIRPFEPVLERVAALEVVDYRFNHAAPDAKRQIGLIAQDVAEQFPELASREGEDGYLGVNYAGFSVVALKAIQEQQDIIEALQAHIAELGDDVATLTTQAGRIEALSKRNAELEARLAALEALLVEDRTVAGQRLDSSSRP